MYNSLAQEVARLRREVAEIRKGQRVAHGASIENAALEVNDDTGTLRAVLGVQPDGTVGVVAHNGPPPGAPSAPVVTPSIAGLRITWDGTFADGSPTPSDFDHITVHVSTTTGFTPSVATFVGTITRAGDGGMLPVTPLPYAAHYVRLVGVNTSGVAGAASAETAGTPVQVDGPDLTAGSVTAETIAAGAVEADKLAAIIALATRIVAGDPAGARVELNAGGLKVYDSADVLKVNLDAATGDATFVGTITGSNITGSTIQTDTSGERITINEADANKILVYDDTGRVVGELSGQGLLLEGTSGAIVQIDPDGNYPAMRFTSVDGLNHAGFAVVSNNTVDADFVESCGVFTGNGFSDMQWRTYLGNDFWVAERIRNSAQTTSIGGRIQLQNGSGVFGYLDTRQTIPYSDIVFTQGNAQLRARFQGTPPASSNTAVYAETAAGHTGYMMRLYNTDAGSYRMSLDLAGNLTIGGMLNAPNIATGTVTITPAAAYTPTSSIVSGLNVAGTTFRGYATANTTVPGYRASATPPGAGVTGVGVSSVSATGLTVWVNRENTTATTINWMVIGS